MAKKPNFGPDFGSFWPKFGPPIFVQGFYLHWMLYIVTSYHCMQFQGKLMNHTCQNEKKT